MIFTWNLDQQLNLTTKTKHRQKNLTMTSFWGILTSLLFFRFMADLEPSKSRIQDAQSVKITFSLSVTFYFTKTTALTKSTALTILLWVKVLYLPKNAVFRKKCWHQQNQEALVLKRIFPETTYVCVLTYQISSF